MLTVIEKPASTDVRSILQLGMRDTIDIELFASLVEEATSGSPMADVALLQLETMMSQR